MDLKQEIEKMVKAGEICAIPDPLVKNQYVIGYNNKTFLVGILDNSPFIDGVLDMSAIIGFKDTLNNFKGAYAVVWDCDSFLRFINGIPPVSNSHLTPENIDLFTWEYF